MNKFITSLILWSAISCCYLPLCAEKQITEFSPWLSKVLEYYPAPGQFINQIPEYEEGDTYNDILQKASEQICGSKKPGMISLGSFGGYVIVAFDHPVVNVTGEYDFKIYGNAISHGNGKGISEPGIVMVSADTNGNSLPDDEWYELAGSDYNHDSTLKNYTVTYFRPNPNAVSDPDPDYKYISNRTYILWEDSFSNQGYVMKNTSHTQSYWPEWLSDKETLKFSGTRLASNVILPENGSGNYNQYVLPWGYVDNQDDAADKGFDISNAVDSNGNSVKLAHIDFIRIHTAVLDYCGWLGESSTEVSGGEDLHPNAVSGIEVTNYNKTFSVYTADGMKIRTETSESELQTLKALSKGLLIIKDNNTGQTFKIFNN